MYFYNLRIKNSSSVNHAITGKFSGHKEHEIIVSRGRILEIFAVDLSKKTLCSLLAIDFNAMIRSLSPIRHVEKDLIAVTSDAGKIVILEFVLEGRYFKTVLEHRFEWEIKVSLRFTPGEFLAVHQGSKTIAIGALEEGVMFYDVSKGIGDFNNPLKMKKPRYVFYDLIEVCSNSEHPLFASLEVRYPKTEENKNASKDTAKKSESIQPGTSKQSKSTSRSKQKSSADILKSRLFASLSKEFGEFLQETDKTTDKTPPMVLVFYEWNVQTKNVDVSEFKLKSHANKLISVPVGDCHQGGVIICFCNEIEFVETGTFEKAHCFIPQRRNVAFNNEKGILISGFAAYKKEENFLLLLQSEEGDLFSAEILKVDEKLKIKMKYVDTVPVASALCIIEGEFLFLGADFGDHFLYKIKSLGSDDEFTSDITELFTARKVENLEICSKLEGLVPVVNCIAPYDSSSRYSVSKSPVHQQTDNANNNLSNLYFACGMGPSSTLRTLKHGVEVQELFSFESFYEDMFIQNVWAFRQQTKDGLKTLIVVSGTSEKNRPTAVLSVDEKINQTDSGFLLSSETLNCVQVGIDAIVQVLPFKVRYLCQGNLSKEHVIKCTCKVKKKENKKSPILKSAAHKNQIAVALMCKEIICAEVIKSTDGTIDLKEKRIMAESNAVAMEFIPREPESEYLVVCFRDSINIYSVGSEEVTSIAEQTLLSVPSSLVCNQVNRNGLICFINIGFEDGSLMKAYLNEKKEINSFSLKLDSKRIELIKLKINDDDAILAMSNQAWISFSCQTQFHLVPLLYSNLVCAAGFFPTNLCPEANLIAVRKIEKKDKNEDKDRKLVFLCVKDVVSLFTESLQQFELTPRQSLWNFKNELLIISQNDYRPPSYKDGDVTPQMAMELTLGVSKYEAPDPKAEYLNQMVRNRPPSKYDCELSIFDPKNKKIVFNQTFPENHVVVRLSLVEFASTPDELHLLASVKKCVLLYPEEKYENFVYTYKVSDNGESFELIDKADMVDVPSAMCPFNGYVLIGVKNKLWLCDLEKKLIFKFSVELPCNISSVYARQNLYVVLCGHQNVIYGFWNEDENKLQNVHEDKHLGCISTLCFLNDDIMIAADISGYLNVVLLPAVPSITDEEDVKKSAGSISVQESTGRNMNLARLRFTSNSFVLVKYYLGEIVTSLQKTSFLEKGRKVILYATLSGTVGVLVPFLNETADRMFEPLQYILKIKSFYHNKGSTEWMEQDKDIYSLFEDQHNINVIDGNVCDIFHTLSESEQMEVAGYLKKEPFEINEMLAEMKAKIYF